LIFGSASNQRYVHFEPPGFSASAPMGPLQT
jgi:hypothetical protein